MRETGDPQGVCETTSTPRFFNALCECKTYAGNLGPCLTWEEGGNGRCVYCDHDEQCHLILRGYRHGRNDIDRRPATGEQQHGR
jgi:hypothetical protein